MVNKRGVRKVPSTAVPSRKELQREAASAEGETQEEKADRRANAEKQKRFRKNMKAEGFKQVLLWTIPCPPDVRGRMTAEGFRQVPAWEKPEAGETRQERRRGDPGRVKIAIPIRESSLGVADHTPEVRTALIHALGSFLKVLGEYPEKETLYGDLQELVKPLGNLRSKY
jgi:hypothetical protein